MFKTIQSKLFFSHAILTLGIILTFTLSYYASTARSLYEKASESLVTTAYSINAQLDATLGDMNEMITKVWYSETFKATFLSPSSSSADMLERDRTLQGSILTAVGPDFPLQRVSFFQPPNNFFSMGLVQNQPKLTNTEMMELNWVQQALAPGKPSIIVSPHQDDWQVCRTPVVSYCKAVDTSVGSAPVVIEIQQDYKKFAKIVEKFTLASPLSNSAARLC